jgi:hypothetical protein
MQRESRITRLAVGTPVALRASGVAVAGFGATGVLAVRRSVRWAEIRPDVSVGVVWFCAWIRVVPVVRDRLCLKAAPQTTSRKTCRTCFPRCRNREPPCTFALRAAPDSMPSPPPTSAPRQASRFWPGAARGLGHQTFPGQGQPNGQRGSGRRGCVGARSAQRDRGLSGRPLPSWTSGPGDQAGVGFASVDPARC